MLRCAGILATALISTGVLAASGRAPAQPVKVPQELADVLSRAQDDLRNDQPESAIRRLAAYRGDDNALRHVLLGHAYAKLADPAEAIRAYEKALAMDETLQSAGIALAQLHVGQKHWPQAAQLLGRYLDADACGADALLLYAQVAQQLEDLRLCGLLTRKGVVRFPADERFRRLDVALLLDADDRPAARLTLRWLLDRAPTDPRLWQQLAATHVGPEEDASRLAALEAAALCDPGDLAVQRQLLAAWLGSDAWLSVTAHGQKLLAGPDAEAARADVDLLDLLIRAADLGQDDDLLEVWLGLVDTARRTHAMHLAAAKLAVRTGRTADARRALDQLIEAGQAGPSVFLWAGHLAETSGDTPAAETLYAHARRMEGRFAWLATLHLARLHLRQERFEDASRLLNEYLDARPEDSSARALLALVEARRSAIEGR